MPKDKDTTNTNATAADAETQAEVSTRPVEEPGKARFIRGDQVVDAEGTVIEGLSVKDGEIVGTEKASAK